MRKIMAVALDRSLAVDGGPKAVTLPFHDRWEAVGDEEIAAVTGLLQGVRAGTTGWYDVLDQFERQFSASVGTGYALAHCNGTATLHAAVFAAGVQQGDEVIVPSYTGTVTVVAGGGKVATPGAGRTGGR